MKSSASSTSVKDSQQITDPDKWAKTEGPIRLKESLKKLDQDPTTIGKVNLHAMDYKLLSREKKFVKDELKNYDNEFMKLFKRTPSREEKEPMRPLYVYYKRLKQHLTKVEKDGIPN